MAYIVGTDRYQTRMITTSLDDLISKDNSVRVIDSYVESLDLENLGFIEYSGRNRGQSPYRRSDLLKLHICLLYTSPSPRDRQKSRMPSSA